MNYSITYPAEWPEEVRKRRIPQTSRYNVDMYQVLSKLDRAVKALNLKEAVLSSNYQIEPSGKVLFLSSKFKGVGLSYINHKGETQIITSDKYITVKDNVYAIVRSLEAYISIKNNGTKISRINQPVN